MAIDRAPGASPFDARACSRAEIHSHGSAAIKRRSRSCLDEVEDVHAVDAVEIVPLDKHAIEHPAAAEVARRLPAHAEVARLHQRVEPADAEARQRIVLRRAVAVGELLERGADCVVGELGCDLDRR